MKNLIWQTDALDDVRIKNINGAGWFKTMDHYPETIGHMKLLLSIFDKMDIFNDFDIIKISEMNQKKLNILYAILRIMHKVFNKYLDHVVKKIFRNRLKEIFAVNTTNMKNTSNYDIFFDQLTQDIDHFVSEFVKIQYPILEEKNVKNEFINYLRLTFEKFFYRTTMKKMSYNMEDNFFWKHDDVFVIMMKEFIEYTEETISETYKSMKIFLDTIFDDKCSEEMLQEIIAALKKHIDLRSLFGESCVEIDIYCEQRLDDELKKCVRKKTSKNVKMMSKNVHKSGSKGATKNVAQALI